MKAFSARKTRISQMIAGKSHTCPYCCKQCSIMRSTIIVTFRVIKVWRGALGVSSHCFPIFFSCLLLFLQENEELRGIEPFARPARALGGEEDAGRGSRDTARSLQLSAELPGLTGNHL